ncbi:type II toxin-antitoxin system RelE/ParE family toxin [Inquilinus sp. YAF38]|uniref:type II toxin-antitoxin system RelE/ParE family toxin n=1 Tax=Inquilinus sp. YAF38 TaxID=3233084 RepID=UPI003F90B2BA
MMRLSWTRKATSDLVRLHEFLAPVNARAATETVRALAHAVGRLPQQPRIGVKLDEFAPREVRRIIVGRYEIRYEIDADGIHILRLWHTREDR